MFPPSCSRPDAMTRDWATPASSCSWPSRSTVFAAEQVVLPWPRTGRSRPLSFTRASCSGVHRWLVVPARRSRTGSRAGSTVRWILRYGKYVFVPDGIVAASRSRINHAPVGGGLFGAWRRWPSCARSRLAAAGGPDELRSFSLATLTGSAFLPVVRGLLSASSARRVRGEAAPAADPRRSSDVLKAKLLWIARRGRHACAVTSASALFGRRRSRS